VILIEHRFVLRFDEGMSRSGLILAPLLLLLSSAGITVAADETSFSKDIAPIILNKCVSCHGSEKARGGFRAHTFKDLMTPGKSKSPSITPGKPDASELFARLTATDPDDRMPQKDDALEPRQIEIFKTWISEGAKLDKGSPTDLLAALVPAPLNPLPPAKYPRPIPIMALAFNPAGTELATGGHHEVNIWSTNGELKRRITNVAERVYSIAFDPAGKIMALAGGQPGRSGSLALYNVESGLLETNLLRTPDILLCLKFDDEGKRLAVGGSDNAIHIFDALSRSELTNIQQHADWVTAIDFSADGTNLASASRDRSARVYDPVTGNLETTYTEHEAALSAVAFVPGGKVASGGKERRIDIWNVSDGKRSRKIEGFNGEIFALLVDEDVLYSACGDHHIRAHSSKNGKLLRDFGATGDALFALTIDSTGRRIAAAGYDGKVAIWNTADGALLSNFIAAPGWEQNP
jgi:hypothetical protein